MDHLEDGTIMNTGIIVVVVVVVLSAAFGIWRKLSDGKLKPVPLPDDTLEVDVHSASTQDHGGERLSAGQLGWPLGERATLVQFSTAFCQPCRATKRILSEVAEMVPGVNHLDLDAEAHLDLVRQLDVRRTPTVLVLDANGVIVQRASGLPRKADVIAALGNVL